MHCAPDVHVAAMPCKEQRTVVCSNTCLRSAVSWLFVMFLLGMQGQPRRRPRSIHSTPHLACTEQVHVAELIGFDRQPLYVHRQKGWATSVSLQARPVLASEWVVQIPFITQTTAAPSICQLSMLHSAFPGTVALLVHRWCYARLASSQGWSSCIKSAKRRGAPMIGAGRKCFRF